MMASRHRNFSTTVLLALLIVMAFAWGFMSSLTRTFPYRLIMSVSAEKSEEDVPAVDVSQLKSLPYVAGSEIAEGEKDGITKYMADKVDDGYNLLAPFFSGATWLIDMNGNKVHEWKNPDPSGFTLVRMETNGDLFGIETDKRLVKMDKDSNVLWCYEAKAHHDLDIDQNGNIFLITHKEEVLDRYNTKMPILNDYISVLTRDGKLIEEWPIIKLVEGSPYRNLLPSVNHIRRKNPIDILHTNSIEVFDGRLSGVSPLFKQGNILLSCREINFIFIYDPAAGRIVWGWGANTIYRQHHPSLLDSGHIMVFDNGLQTSVMLEIDPGTDKVTWSYGQDKSTYFRSSTMGSVQRLSNGNTLIAQAESGVAFELTPEKEIVWRYVVPHKFRNTDGRIKRSSMYRIERYKKSELSFLE